MLTGSCHCGSVRVEIPRKPRSLTDCNCSICRRYGALWAYYKASTVRVVPRSGATAKYAWRNKVRRFVRCNKCGCVMIWERVRPQPASYVGVNARNFEPAILSDVRIRRLDGASSWKYID